MATRLYRWLVRLHPPAFRERFAAEMLCVYDDADWGERPRLLADGVVSVARQWVLRSRYWIAGAAALGALLQLVVAGTASFGATSRALTGLPAFPSFSEDPSAQGTILLLGAGLVCAFLVLMIALASLVRGAARGKS
jgi:hypothetical protein